jgi:hypothetical protein
MKVEILSFFKEHISDIEALDGGGTEFCYPNFDLKPKDFLGYAKDDLAADITIHSLINVTGNLKRAMDCQLDYLLSALNMDTFYREKRLGIDRKLGFFEKAGVFRASSLARLNKLRNRLEHHYETPKLDDVRVYYDLVAAFISIGDSFLYKIRSISEVSLYYLNTNFETAVSTSIGLERPRIALNLVGAGSEYRYCIDLSDEFTVEKLYDFAYLLKVNMLVGDFYYTAISNNDFISALEYEACQNEQALFVSI